MFKETYLHPAPEPQSRSARVYQVDTDKLGMSDYQTEQSAVLTAKRRHAKVTDTNYHDLVARKIGHGNGYVDVVVVE